jgi:hypothetical protein
MTVDQSLDLAVRAFEERNLQEPADADRFFAEFGVGNTDDFPNRPFERFTSYKQLLLSLRDSNPLKFESVHKGTPLYFLSWLAFDQHQFDAALHFLDAAIAEDRRIDSLGWFNYPGPQILMLNASPQAARRTVELLSSRIAQELQRFEKHYGVVFSREDFLRRFAEPLVKSRSDAIVAGFYAFVLEFDDRAMEICLRSAPKLGSYQPLFLHLFKGGLLLETLLKHTFPYLAPLTLGKILRHKDFENRVGFNPGSIREVSINTLCADALPATPESAFLTTGRLRNMMGHNLIRDPLATVPEDYITLARQEINAFLYAVFKLYP